MCQRSPHLSALSLDSDLAIGARCRNHPNLQNKNRPPSRSKRKRTPSALFGNQTTLSRCTHSLLALFSGLLVTVSIVQIRYLIRADRTARITAEAAKDQTVLTRQAMVDTQRAFVLVKALEVELVTFPYQSPTAGIIDRIAGWRIGVVWENSGDTPTRDLITHVSLQIFR